MNDLELLLKDAISQQSRRRSIRRRAKTQSTEWSSSNDYALRLKDRAIYRKLITESDIAQDGLRFVWWFGQPANHAGRSLDDWRRLIDKGIKDAHYRAALSANSQPTRVDDPSAESKPALDGEEPLSDST